MLRGRAGSGRLNKQKRICSVYSQFSLAPSSATAAEHACSIKLGNKQISLNGTFSDSNRLCHLDGGLGKETQKEAQLLVVWPRSGLEKTQ